MTKNKQHPLATWWAFGLFILLSFVYYTMHEGDIQGQDMDASPMEELSEALKY